MVSSLTLGALTSSSAVPHSTAVSTTDHARLSSAAVHDASIGFSTHACGLWHCRSQVLSDGRRAGATPKTTSNSKGHRHVTRHACPEQSPS
jgi:hypothetical protein